jgi:hypothetical protein
MSEREAIIDEIKTAPESLVREAYDFILFLKRRRELESGAAKPQSATAKPDFLARQQSLFGNRVLPDSQAIPDELRLTTAGILASKTSQTTGKLTAIHP